MPKICTTFRFPLFCVRIPPVPRFLLAFWGKAFELFSCSPEKMKKEIFSFKKEFFCDFYIVKCGASPDYGVGCELNEDFRSFRWWPWLGDFHSVLSDIFIHPKANYHSKLSSFLRSIKAECLWRFGWSSNVCRTQFQRFSRRWRS